MIPPPDGDMALYIESLEKLLQLKIRLLLPGHGPVIDDPYGKIREYIDHRLMREQEVLESLRDGVHTIPAIAARIYAELAAPLAHFSQLSVEAHLVKLTKERRVVKEGGRYFLTEKA